MENAMDAKALTIRPAEREDLDAMVSLLQALFSIEKDFTPDPDRQRRGLLLFLDGCGKHRSILVGEMEDRVIAMATVQILISTAEGGYVGLVEDVIVREDCRCRGVGLELMTALTSWAAQRGLTRLQLLADQHNQPALDFYRKMGWHLTRLVCLRKADMRTDTN
jgi:ribosomal protein S18 acetylase RimI-like enzyme